MNAARQGSGWVVTELWLPTTRDGRPAQTPSGTPYSEIRPDLFRVVCDEYRTVSGLRPVGPSFFSEFDGRTPHDEASDAAIAACFESI